MLGLLFAALPPEPPRMMFADTSRGRPYAKDPHVIRFGGRYLMYYSVPPYGDGRANDGWAIGIAASADLVNWRRVGEMLPGADYEAKGLCAPAALVRGRQVHLFYQTYGNGPRDAICHAVSEDGLTFKRDASNPIFRPTGDWNNGRAIDAEVLIDGDRALLYYATRDPLGQTQLIGVAAAPARSSFARSEWKQLGAGAALAPTLPWEKKCVEGPSVVKRDGRYYMFYAGAYNNEPQQIGLAVSSDGVTWTRASQEPFLTNGKPGEWNSSESGHPHLFADPNGGMHLFFQGNRTGGKDWYLSQLPLRWGEGGPSL